MGFGGAGLGYGATSPVDNWAYRKCCRQVRHLQQPGRGDKLYRPLLERCLSDNTAVDDDGSGINLRSSDIFHVHMTYDGVNLAMTVIDVYTQQSFSTSWPVDVPGTVGGTSAYVGFTGASGGRNGHPGDSQLVICLSRSH